jgi:hypothetical protein
MILLRPANHPEAASVEYARPWIESPGNDEARHAGVWMCAFLHAQLVMPCTGDGRERLHMGRTRGVVRAWPVVMVTDQDAAIGAPVHVNVFQHGVAKMRESRCV